MPAVKVIAALINPTNINAERMTKDLHAGASALGIELEILSASSEADFEPAFERLAQLDTNGLIVSPDPFFTGRSDELVDFALRHRLAGLFFSRDFVSAGGLMSYGGSVAESHRQAGIYAGRILKGAAPAELPVQQVTKFDLAINLKTAKMLGLSIPQALLATADEVIE
jgi:putative ABC transport system substrate-binding protein